LSELSSSAGNRAASEITAVAGLGNPGKRYERTRHNAGFLLVDEIAGEVEKAGSRVVWKDRFGAQAADVSWRGFRLLLIKPQKFMNLSGGPISEILGFVKLGSESLVVAHDEIDLPAGTLRVKQGGGDGGHNGLSSITECLGSNYCRLRLGVGRPAGVGPDGSPRPTMEVADWVLTPFAKEEGPAISGLLSRAADALETLLKDGLKTAQNRFNG